MRSKEIDRNQVFQSLRGAAAITGLSYRYLRDGCISGTVPHIRCGTDYRVNMPLLMEQLDTQSKEAQR